MGKTLDLGRRIELHSMDPYCHGVSVALYRTEVAGAPRFLVHTYSCVDGVRERVAFIRQALLVALGMEVANAPSDSPVMSAHGWIQFPCRSDHLRALKRAFLDLCKLETGENLTTKPLTVFDKKANGEVTAESRGAGVYEVRAAAGAAPRRATAIARGFAKLCEMDLVEAADQIVFPCKISHDALIGMLMFRAQNVRGAMKEGEIAAARGILSAPSQQ